MLSLFYTKHIHRQGVNAALIKHSSISRSARLDKAQPAKSLVELVETGFFNSNETLPYDIVKR
jgi:hypothetical protein